jgi:hypothetical protein
MYAIPDIDLSPSSRYVSSLARGVNSLWIHSHDLVDKNDFAVKRKREKEKKIG